MSFSLGVIDEKGEFGPGALEKIPESKALFIESAERLKRSFAFIDASFCDGRLDVSDYVLPLWNACENAELEVPILNDQIPYLRVLAEKAIVDDRVRNVVLGFLLCAERSGLDIVFSG